jgi:hypothetical protein
VEDAAGVGAGRDVRQCVTLPIDVS